MPPKNHVHKYRKSLGKKTKANANSGFHDYYKCGYSDCTHYLRAELILGKKSVCNRCSKEFILPLAIRNLTNLPHCKACTKRKPDPVSEVIDNNDDEMEIEV